MLYLEDYVELIEHLPVDLRDRFTDMRELDLQVQNTVDDLNGRVKALFRECSAKKGKFENADEVFEDIRKTYRKALGDAEDKVHLADQIYELVDRHLRKLDQELAKFKMELEADNGGITEILEQRSLELDNPPPHSTQPSRKHAHSHSYAASSQGSNSSSVTPQNGVLEKKMKLDIVDNWHSESAPPSVMSAEIGGSFPVLDMEKSNSRPPSRSSISGSRHSHASNIEVPGADFRPIDIQPRRSSNTKSNLELVKQEPSTKVEAAYVENPGSLKAEDIIDDDSAQSGVDISTSPHPAGSRPSRTKKQTSRAAAWTQERMQAEARRGHARDKDHGTNYSNVEVTEGTSASWTCDPHEPRYCLCNQVSYGEMVGCDNPKCAIEWFHYECVNLTEAPKGKWYCPQCTQTMKRRNKNKTMT